MKSHLAMRDLEKVGQKSFLSLGKKKLLKSVSCLFQYFDQKNLLRNIQLANRIMMPREFSSIAFKRTRADAFNKFKRGGGQVVSVLAFY